MKGLSSSRGHLHTANCDLSYDPLSHQQERKPYLISPVDSHPGDHGYYPQRNSFHSDCTVQLNDQTSSSTFPRRHYSSHHDLKDECALAVAPTSNKINRIPPILLDQFERQLPIRRDGFHTLQYKRAALEHRSESPGRIRHLVHSVQKLFTKSHSLEGPARGHMNGGKANPDEVHAPKRGKRSKSRERKSEVKNKSNMSSWWSSDDNLDGDVCLYHGPTNVMTVGRCPDRSVSQYFMEAYNTISEQTMKTSRGNNDMKCTTCVNIPLNVDAQIMKKSSWSSTLTVSRAHEVYQKSSMNLDNKTLMKSETCQQERSCQYLQVPQDEWSGYSPQGKEDEIPCRRMRSGSYIKAMADDDSGDSDTSPKPSPKIAARRESYLKATQPSLTELTTLKISSEHSPKLQIRSHSYLRAVSDVSINRSLDSLDPAVLLASPKFRSRNESYMRAMSTISQVSEVEVNGQFESVCESVFSELESKAVEALDLPMPGCFRMRSHSYVRAIERGCSQDDECLSLRSASPPRTTTTVRTIQSSTVSSCITTYKKNPPPVPPRTTIKPFISITAQSSTESAQDAYLDGHTQRGDLNSVSGLSNSTESLDSVKALTAAIEAANAQVHGPSNSQQYIDSPPATNKGIPPVEEPKWDVLRKSKCSSVGIQVDGPEQLALADMHTHKFQSVGIQVETEKCFRRFTRSNSVTTAVQADLDSREHSEITVEPQEVVSSPLLRQLSKDTCTASFLASEDNHLQARAQENAFDSIFDPSFLPPPEPWIDSTSEAEVEAGQRSVCQRDGRWFMKLLQAEKERMDAWCQQMEKEEQENALSEEILGKIRSAVGSAQLLMSQKFQQFSGLCEENMNPNACPRLTSQDLAGFWDMLQLSIENVSMKFDELHQLKANCWKQVELPEKKEKRIPPPVPKKPPKGQVPLKREKSLEATEKQRQEARKRLMAAKRAASVRQNSATESADSIEIYIPEAQTRL
ncbi:disks large-associated protein 1 isoform X1 [Leucoraja erinacea]|uniref:disks large-associated protein 1 isoform X1 n=1 Tax=Leucoraja erinaceus TaxID=7782 RepID=UPI00245430A6|nr:disks large-associated protein 1 isoform X1 [Leucoraja erinacea]XP_055490185.1 disks large-associated protein 1 isoform X1 [Leucoraja erinacea]